MKKIYVIPRPGRTVRFPAGHARAGDVIPPEGATVPESSFFVRFINRGDLVRDVVATMKPTAAPTPSAPSAPTAAPVDFAKMKKAELVELVESFGVDPSGLKKSELVELLETSKEG